MGTTAALRLNTRYPKVLLLITSPLILAGRPVILLKVIQNQGILLLCNWSAFKNHALSHAHPLVAGIFLAFELGQTVTKTANLFHQLLARILGPKVPG